MFQFGILFVFRGAVKLYVHFEFTIYNVRWMNMKKTSADSEGQRQRSEYCIAAALYPDPYLPGRVRKEGMELWESCLVS